MSLNRRSKYNAKKIRACKICGLPFNIDCPHGEENEHTFDSKAEHKRFQELLLLQKAGKIINLQIQPKYPMKVNEEKIGTYIADFFYEEKSGALHGAVVEDCKGFDTALSKWKRKHVYAQFGIKVKIVQ